MRKMLLAITGLCLIASSADAHKIVNPGPRNNIAKNAFSATPKIEWNKLQQTQGKYQEIWTIDGDQLNKVTFYGGVPAGEPLFRERDKKNAPLPKVAQNMLITDIPNLLETTYRTQFQTSQMRIGTQEAVTVSGRQGIRFSYTFVRNDDQVERKGEGIGSFVGNKLFLVTYEAPSLFFYDRTLSEFRQIASTLKIAG